MLNINYDLLAMDAHNWLFVRAILLWGLCGKFQGGINSDIQQPSLNDMGNFNKHEDVSPFFFSKT